MNRLHKMIALLLTFMLLLPGSGYADTVKADSPITILFTHDLHDNLLPFNMEDNAAIQSWGGFARLKTAIDQQRKNDPQLLLVDAGDFSMGTLFQTEFSGQAPELRLLGQMGYDATTLGNHEFDFRPAGLAGSLRAAKTSQERVPFLVAGNISYPADQQGKIKDDLIPLRQAMNAYGVKDYTVLERKGYRIGVFGIMGYDAAAKAPKAGVEFSDPLERAASIVDKLQNQEKVDMIICLSHSGTVADREKAEDVILAQKVPEIDVIISGHSHTKMEEPMIVGDTIIGSAGEYGENLGMVSLQPESAGVWKQVQYRLIPINAGMAADAAVDQQIEYFKSLVQKDYLDPLGMKFEQVLAYAPYSFAALEEIYDQHCEQPLGNLISDAYIYGVKQAEGEQYQPIAAAIVPNGTIRASVIKGNVTVADAYNISSLGIGPDNKSGYPLISVYLTGKELKTACEVDASITPLMNDAQLYMSGITYTFNPHRLMFNKVSDAALQPRDGKRSELDDDELYRVVVNLYSAQMLSVVGEKSFGLLSIVPKTREGKPISDYEAQIIRDKSNGSELKEWVAIARYLQSFDQVGGMAQIPDYYNQAQGRKIIDQNTSILARLSQPNTIAWAVYGLITLVILLIILLIRRIIRRRVPSRRITYLR